MIFSIQASNPRFRTIMNPDDECLAEAIESIFPLNTENVILTWNCISVPLSYKYDISYMVNDILLLLSVIQKEDIGKMTIQWLPDTFRCDWLIQWNIDEVQIDSHWECTVGHLEDILNQRKHISLLKSDFVNEWKEVLGVVIKGLECCGYHKSKIKYMNELTEQYEQIKMSGVLYRD